MQEIDISEELRIFRTGNGILLAHPEESFSKNMPLYYDMNHTVYNILELPCNVYFSDTANRYQLVNDYCAESCGFDSSQSALNKTIYDTATPESAKILCDTNHEVMKTNTIKILEEELILNNDFLKQGISIKLPCYNNQHKLIGIFGVTIIFGKHKLGELLSYISDIGLLNKNHGFTFNVNNFTKRENEIIYWLIRNKTAKEIGKQLYVSRRTVEKHIENIKGKLDVKSKSDLVCALMEQNPL